MIQKTPTISNPAPPRGSRFLALTPLLSSLLALAFFRFYSVPAEPRFQICGFHGLTGRPCPLCGMTRALSFLLRGHWEEAMRFHPLSPMVLAILCGAVWVGMIRWRVPDFSWRFIPAWVRRNFWTGCVILFVGYGVLRLCLGAP